MHRLIIGPQRGLRAAAFGLTLTCLTALPMASAVAAGAAEVPAAFPFRDTAEGVSCSFFDVALGLRWPDEAVSWIDALGRPGGAKPYDSQTLSRQQPPRLLRFDVLALVKAWGTGAIANEGLVLAAPSASSGGGADFHARESADIGARPSLRVQHRDGSVEYLSPVADAHLACSTYTGLGAHEVLHIGPDSMGVFRFDLDRLRKGKAQTAVAAELILVRHEGTGVWSDGPLGVYRLATPWSQTFVPVGKGLAARFSADKGVTSHPAVLFADAFEAGQLKPGWNTAQLVQSRVMQAYAAPDSAGQVLALPNLRVVIPKGENLGLDLRYDFARTAGQPDRSEAYLRYYLRLGPEWVGVPDSGKLPGLAGTYNRAGWGGRGWHGMQGWSARGSFAKGQPPEHPAHGRVMLASYVYHSKSASSYGDIMPWGGSQGAALIVPGRWYCIEQHVRLNTPGQENGVLRAWVDGKPVFERRNLRLRDTMALGIENAWMDVYMGGQKPALQNMVVQIARVVVASSYIGPSSP